MARDQDIVKQLQQRFGLGILAGCRVHRMLEYCEYDKQGQLTKLHLCRLGLSWVPSDVWQLSSLEQLYLTDNQLSTLPTGVKNLSSLCSLDLTGNQFSTWPDEVKNLPSLESLFPENNQLSMLPAEVGNLSSLQKLQLDNNPLLSPIIAQGTSAVLAYLRALPQAVFIACTSDRQLDVQVGGKSI